MSSTGGGRRCNSGRSPNTGSTRRSRGTGRQRCGKKVTNEDLATNDHNLVGGPSLTGRAYETPMPTMAISNADRRDHWELVSEFVGSLGMTLRSGIEYTASASSAMQQRSDESNDKSKHAGCCEQRDCDVLPSCQEREAIISDEEEQHYIDEDDLSVRDHARLLLNFMSSSPSPNALLCDEDIDPSENAESYPTAQPDHTTDTEVMTSFDDEQRCSLDADDHLVASPREVRVQVDNCSCSLEAEECEQEKDQSEDCMTEEEDCSEQTRFSFTCPSLSLESDCELGPYGSDLNVTKVATPSPPPSEDEETRHMRKIGHAFGSVTNRYPGVRESGAVPKPAQLFRRPIGSLDRDDIAATSRSMVQNFLQSFETAMEWRAKSWIHSLSKIVLFKRERLIDAWNAAEISHGKPRNDASIEQEIIRSKEAFVMEALAVAMTHVGVLEVTTRYSLQEPLLNKDEAREGTGKRGPKKSKRASSDSCTVTPSPRKKRAGVSTRSQISKASASLAADEEDSQVREAARVDFSPIVPPSFTVEYPLDFEAIVTVSTGTCAEADDDQQHLGQVVPFTVTLQAPGIARGFFLNEEGQLGGEVLGGVEVDIDTEVLALGVEQQTRMVVRKAAETYLATAGQGEGHTSRSEQGLVTSPDAETQAKEVLHSPVLKATDPYMDESFDRGDHQTIGPQAVIVTPRYRSTPKPAVASPRTGEAINPVPDFPLESEDQQVIGQRRRFPNPRRLSSGKNIDQLEHHYQEEFYHSQIPYNNSSAPPMTDSCKPPSPRSTTTTATVATETTAAPFVSPLPSTDGKSEAATPCALRSQRPYFRDLDDDVKSSKRRLPAPRNGGGTSLPALVQVCAAALCTD